ncbi:MAG: TonB family protein [Verrucomicrobiota bacterium]
MPTLQTYRPVSGRRTPFSASGPPELHSPLVRQSLGYEKPENIHDGLGWLVLTLALCVLSVGWTAYFLPRTAPLEMGGGDDPADASAEDSAMMEAAAEAEPESTETEAVPPPEPEVTAEEIPEPVPVVEAPDAVTVPAPPEIVKPLQVTEPKPERPRVTTPPAPSRPRPAPRSTRPAGTAAATSATASTTNGGGGGGSGSGQGPGKNQKNKTPKPPYPPWARAAKVTGTILFRLVIDATGRVSSASVVRSCGNARLDSETLAFIRNRWFLPASAGSTQPSSWTYRLKN